MSLEHDQLSPDSVLSRLQDAISRRPASGSLPPTIPAHDPLLGTVLEGTSSDPAVLYPHRAHPHSDRDSASDSGPDSESDFVDEDCIMEDDEHHRDDDDVVDHLDVIGPPRHTFLPGISFVTLLLPHRPSSRHGRSSYERRKRCSSVISPLHISLVF
jgi:hypothetical protein